MSTELVMLCNHLILYRHLLLPSIFPSTRIFLTNQLFASGGQNIGASASASASKEYSELISLRIVCFDLLVVQGTLKNLLQDDNFKASILWLLAFFMVQLSHSYMTTGKIIDLTDLCRQSDVSALNTHPGLSLLSFQGTSVF